MNGIIGENTASRPQISNLISVYEAAMNPRDIKPAADKLILAGSTCRSNACIFFLFPSPLFLVLLTLSRPARHSFRSIRLGARFLNIHRSRERERRPVLSRVVFDSTKNMEQGREGTKLTNKWHE